MTAKLQGFGVQLKPITQDKIELIRQWRNHPDIASNMFNQNIITKEQQQMWFDLLAQKTDQHYWIISYKSQDIGVASGLSSDNKPLNESKEIIPGLYLAPECRYKYSVLAFSPSLVLLDYFFSFANCESIVAQVFAHNASALRYNESLGYQVESDEINSENKQIITMRLTQEHFEIAKIKLSKILRF